MAKKLKVEELIDVIYNNKGMVEAQKDNKKLEETGKKLNKTLTKAFGLGKLSVFAAGIKKTTEKISYLTGKSADFIEQLNVLDVAFDGNTESIRKFTSAISETLNLDEASIIKMAAAFKTLGNSMNYSQELGNRFSRMMTQVTLDTASLFNMTLEKSQSMMQQAIQGQGKSLKANTGVSVLETTVQTTLDVLGIDAYVEDMNDAEKALARTIAITYQLRNAQGDLARTIEAPANRMRVLTEQISQLARNIGNVLLPVINAILPYLNAVLIVLNKIISSLAALVGFKEDAWDNYTNNAESLGDAFDNLGTSIGGVGDAAAETKKQLMGLRGFDKLNVIKTPTSSGGTGGGGGGGINQNLLDAFNKINYKSALEGIETEATKIAKKIMKALGEIDFTNLINAGKKLWEAFKPFAENVGKGLLWTFDNVLKPLAKWYISDYLPVWLEITANAFKILNQAIEGFKPIGDWLWKNFLKPLAKWTGGTIVNTLKKFRDLLGQIAKSKIVSTVTTLAAAGLLLYKNFGKVVTILGKSKLLGAISKLLTPTKNLFENIKIGKVAYGNLGTAIGKATDEWRVQQGIIDRQTGKINGLKGVLNGLETAFQGVLIGTVGLSAVSTAFQNMATDGANLGNVVGGLAGIFGTAVGGAEILGSAFGPWGTAIGGAAGAIVGLVKGIEDYNYVASGLKEFNESTQATFDTLMGSLDGLSTSYQKVRDSINDNYAAKQAELEQADVYMNSLYNLVDENGKVKDGFEDEAQVLINKLNEAYGSNITLQDGMITNNGQILKDKQDMIKLSEEYAEKLLKQIMLESYIESYNEAKRVRKEAQKELNKAQEEYIKELEELDKKYPEAERKGEKYQNALKELQTKNNKSVEEYKNILYETYPVISGLGKVTHTYATGTEKDLEDVIKSTEKTTKASVKSIDDETTTAGNKVNDLINNKLKRAQIEQEQSQKRTIDNFNTNQKKIWGFQDDINKINSSSISPSVKIDFTNAYREYNSFANDISSRTIHVKANYSGKANGGILVNGKWRDVATYDTGGLPPVGQMFVARERGPELVGTIGGNTAVMNNNQIVSSVSAGVYQAVRSAMSGNNNGNGVYNIYLDKDHKLGTYTLEQLQGMARTNGKPITIG